MRKIRWADIGFFLRFTGVMHSILYGSLIPGSFNFMKTLVILVGGMVTLIGSFIILRKQKKTSDESEHSDIIE